MPLKCRSWYGTGECRIPSLNCSLFVRNQQVVSRDTRLRDMPRIYLLQKGLTNASFQSTVFNLFSQ